MPPNTSALIQWNLSLIHIQMCIRDSIITSRGPGTAFDFALFVAETLTDKETAGKVAKGMLLDTDYAKQLQ